MEDDTYPEPFGCVCLTKQILCILCMYYDVYPNGHANENDVKA